MPLDAQCAQIVQAAAQAGAPFAAADAVAIRQGYAATTARYTHAVDGALEVTDRTIAGPGGPLSIRLYGFADNAVGSRGALVFFHGGGWAVGDLDTHDHVCRYLAVHSECIVIGWRRSTSFPQPMTIAWRRYIGWPRMPANWASIRHA